VLDHNLSLELTSSPSETFRYPDMTLTFHIRPANVDDVVSAKRIVNEHRYQR
jgi:hypothetical protein